MHAPALAPFFGRGLLAVVASLAATACAAPSDPASASAASDVSRTTSWPSALERLAEARALGSPAGSALSDNEAYEVALYLCGTSSGAKPCAAPTAELTAALDDVAVNTRVALGAWTVLHERVVQALALTRTDAPPTVADWPTRRRGSHEVPAPLFALDYGDAPTDAWSTFLSQLAAHDGAVLERSGHAIIDPTGKLVAFHVRAVLNPCNGCADELDVTIGVDGTLLEKHFSPGLGYCC